MSTVQKRAVIGPAQNGSLMTPEEFDAAEDWKEGYRYELINGVLIVNPPADVTERGPNDRLGHMLRNYRDQHPEGQALDYTVGEQTVRIGPNRRRPDRAIWAGLGRLPDVDRDAPTVTVEFVGRRRRDRKRDYETKRQEYKTAGVGEYWIIDRFQRTMTVVRFGPEGPTEQVVREDETYSPPCLPGFTLRPGQFFAEAAALDRARRAGGPI